MSDTLPPAPAPAPPPVAPLPAPPILPPGFVTPQTVQTVAQTAQAAANAVLTAQAGTEPTWAKPAVSILTLVVFVGLLLISWLNKDQTSFNLLCGAGIAMAQSVVGYDLGSSSGSAQKTAIMASQQQSNS